jgi:uncharacterized phage protein gp47/JayE
MTLVFDDTGLSVNGYADNVSELETLYKNAFGEDIKTAEDSTMGLLIKLNALSLTEQNELAEGVANAFNLSTASGSQLSNLVLLLGIQRQESAYSTVSLSCTANTKGTTIPAGSLVSDDAGNQFATDSQLVVGASATGNVSATAVVAGAVSAAAGELTTIVNPVYGWASVTNLAAASEGQSEETDAALRLRAQTVAERSSSVSVSALFQAISDVSGVTVVLVNENTTSSTDADGVPAHNVWCIVQGGADADIAEAIFEHKAAGIGTYGTTSVTHYDATTDRNYSVSFSRPIDTNIWCTVNITTDVTYPADGDDQISDAIIAYFNDNFGMGDDIIHSRLYTPINTVAGHTVDSMFIGTAASPAGTADISIPDSQIGKIIAARIVVNS